MSERIWGGKVGRWGLLEKRDVAHYAAEASTRKRYSVYLGEGPPCTTAAEFSLRKGEPAWGARWWRLKANMYVSRRQKCLRRARESYVF